MIAPDMPLARTLRVVADLLDDAVDPWWVIAGAAAALHGVDDGAVGDVDVLLSPRDARHVLAAAAVEPAPGADSPLFRSAIFARIDGAPLPIELMADFAHRADGRWETVAPTTREPVTIGATTVFVPSRAELCAMLTRFGRAKDLRRAAALRR